MSITTFKVLVKAYLRNRQNVELVEDCLSAVSLAVDTLLHKLDCESL